MELLFKNSDATKNYNLCTVGLYATGSDKQEYLYSITVLRNPQVINTDSAGSTFGLSLNTIVGDAATVNVTITDAGAITQAILDAELANVVHKTGTEEIGGQKTFDIAPIDKTTGNPYITKDGVPSLPSDIARTGQANTFSPLQTFSQGVKTLQTGSYDDANSLVNEGLYYNTNSSIKNGAGSITTGYIQVMSGYGEIVRQIMYSDTDGGVIYDRTSQDGGSSWSNWVQIITWDQIPSDLAFTDQDTNFTSKLQHNGQDVALANNTIYRNPNTSGVADNVNFTGTVQKSGSDVITQANWVESDSDTNAQSSSTSDAEGFYYTKEES